MCRSVVPLTMIVLAVTTVVAQRPVSAQLDAAMKAFWDADDQSAVDQAAKQVVASGASFDEIRSRLKAGRPYVRAKTGRIDLPTRDHGLALDNVLEVPADYDPEPLVTMFRKAKIALEWNVYPDAGHDVSWWPQERGKYEAFLAAHARDAHPERASWETERTDRYNRFRWLVIDRLGKRASDVVLEDVNAYSPVPIMQRTLFARDKPSGRVDAVRTGNGFDVKTRGVQQFTLLLSPDVVDFSKPVRVAVNGKVAHDAIVKLDAATLLTWAARDQDRTMLYGAEVHVVVP